MANPKGNPETLKPFTTDREEPLTAKLTVRITESMETELKKQDNPPEFVREAIAEKLDKQGK
ncbi:hypothetical protein Cylst_0733 [Cylindrospermum stagnale PCC 7417]|uniref:Uncharacterized protein n=1 Tax=Cylindrospermum stagnale PCC 7417 TaxID=56107 RepID=K9WRS6_9NOST|nr:hypothetical protein [Cylindrospermum stagnale]AFZ23060.1 hypothetical protein Cylst_0733 [Cylindrospermum stagnale PCC 7417]